MRLVVYVTKMPHHTKLQCKMPHYTTLQCNQFVCSNEPNTHQTVRTREQHKAATTVMPREQLWG